MFIPGQLVICVTRFIEYPDLIYPVYNKIYTVRDVFYSEMFKEQGLRLQEIHNEPTQWIDSYGEAAFESEAFRPVVENKIDVFRKLLAPTPKVKERV